MNEPKVGIKFNPAEIEKVDFHLGGGTDLCDP